MYCKKTLYYILLVIVFAFIIDKLLLVNMQKHTLLHFVILSLIVNVVLYFYNKFFAESSEKHSINSIKKRIEVLKRKKKKKIIFIINFDNFNSKMKYYLTFNLNRKSNKNQEKVFDLIKYNKVNLLGSLFIVHTMFVLIYIFLMSKFARITFNEIYIEILYIFKNLPIIFLFILAMICFNFFGKFKFKKIFSQNEKTIMKEVVGKVNLLIKYLDDSLEKMANNIDNLIMNQDEIIDEFSNIIYKNYNQLIIEEVSYDLKTFDSNFERIILEEEIIGIIGEFSDVRYKDSVKELFSQDISFMFLCSDKNIANVLQKNSLSKKLFTNILNIIKKNLINLEFKIDFVEIRSIVESEFLKEVYNCLETVNRISCSIGKIKEYKKTSVFKGNMQEILKEGIKLLLK